MFECIHNNYVPLFVSIKSNFSHGNFDFSDISTDGNEEQKMPSRKLRMNNDYNNIYKEVHRKLKSNTLNT